MGSLGKSRNDRSSGPSPEGPQGDADQPRSPSERAYRGILRALYENALVPGQRLVAPDLMKQFEVGRGTIREVLYRLTSTGVVSIVPNRGAQVRIMSRSEVDDLLDIVEALLALAARGAAAAIHVGQDADRLREWHQTLQRAEAPSQFHDFVAAREDYYRGIVQLSGNSELQRLFPAAQVHIMRAQLRRFQNAGDAIDASDFNALTEAILSGDTARAEQAARDHVGFTRTRIASLPNHAFATAD
ncbi:GntR family transcriptional regulator [Altericroceibacterium spongiae]|uniref:GntR family transcriptional regulator n=1 Tax=Altericroceibacterium spongiae TaxID=2320269 RepID=A0A420EQZ4_9SPHN|nr:GntR family transcriptional regulator [Altericroceibacterium spongiae]RKF23081.1 GntR family transcriptional regulator [Altericroceibacterium spongiae]